MYNKVKIELLVAIRDKRSQNYINGKLGYAHNYVSKWENDKRKISWINFVRLCEVCKQKTNLQNALIFLGVKDNVNQIDYVAIIKSIQGIRKIKELSRLTGISRYTLGRWLKGVSCPSLEDIFILIDKSMGNFIDFISSFSDIEKNIPSLKDEYEKYLIQRNIFCDHPLTSIINCFLHHKDYEKSPKYIAGSISKKFGFSSEEEKIILSLLTKSEIIEMKKGKYQFCENEQNKANTGGDYFKGLVYKKYWLEKNLALIDDLIKNEKRSEDSLFGYSFLCVSEKGYEKIIQKSGQFLKEITTMEADGPLDRVIMTNLQILDIEEVGEAELLRGENLLPSLY